MTKVASILFQPILTSSTPFLIGISCFLVKQLFTKGFQVISWQNFHDQDQSREMTLNSLGFGVYSNFFTFLLSMFLIEIILRIVQQRIKSLLRVSSKVSVLSNKSSDESEEVKLFGIISENHIIRLLCYIGIFVVLQIAGFSLGFIQNEISNIHKPIITTQDSTIKLSEMIEMNTRVLQEEEEDNEKTLVHNPLSISRSSDKISLSMGKTLSSLDFDASAIVLSKNRKIAFATIDFYGTLKIIDISDLQSPLVMSSLNLNLSGNLYRTKALTLSSDEKTLYLSNSRDLEIVDISNPRSPKLISFTSSEVFDDDLFFEIPKSFRTSLAFDESTKTLFIGGIGLQIYDVSNPKQPEFLKGFTNDLEYTRFTRNEISLSNDGKALFIANGTLDIYDITEPQEMNLIRSIPTEGSARSIFLPPEDSSVVFLLGASSDHSFLFLEEVNISNYETARVIETFQINDSYAMGSHILAVSPSKTKFFLSIAEDDRNSHLLVFDSIKRRSKIQEKALIEKTQTMIFSTDGKILISGSNAQFVITELFLDYPNSNIFSRSSVNMVSNFSLAASCEKMEISKDGKNLFILRRDDNDPASLKKVFEIWDVKSENAPKLLGSYQLSYGIKQIYFMEKDHRIYLVSDYKIFVLDISNREKPNLIKTWNSDTNKKEEFRQIEISSDGKIGFVTLFENEKLYVTFFNLQGEDFERLGTLEKEFESTECRMLLKDDDFFIIIDEKITIFDISDIHFPVEITSLPILTTEPEVKIISNLISSDNKTLYIESSDRNGFTKLRIYNISEIRSPQLISEKYFSRFSRNIHKAKFSLSPDLKTGFIFQDNSLVRVNPFTASLFFLKKIKNFNEHYFSFLFRIFLARNFFLSRIALKTFFSSQKSRFLLNLRFQLTSK